MPFQGSSEVFHYTAGSKIRCPVCHQRVGDVPPNTVCTVRGIASYSEAEPGTSAHLCTERVGRRPSKKCGALYELRSIDLRAASSEQNPIRMSAVA